MLHYIAVEVLVRRMHVLLQLSFGNFTLFVLAKLVFRGDPAVESAHVEDLEDDIQDDEQGDKGASCDEQEYRAEEQRPDYPRDYGQELYEGDNHDKACDRVLSADVLRPTGLLLALAKECDEATEESCYEEREGQDADIVDGEEDASSAVIVCLPAFRTCRNADALVHVECWSTALAKFGILGVAELACWVRAADANKVILVLYVGS